MKKRFASMILILAMLIGLAPRAMAAGVFADVEEGSWYAPSVSFVYENGLMKGTDSTSFEPHTTMSRAMLVTVLHRIAGEPEAVKPHPFTDLNPGAWYEKAVAWAYESGVVKGVSDREFCPDNEVTREQMVTIFCRYAAYEGADCSASADLSGYADRAEVDAYALESFRWAVENGIVNGTDATHLSPNANASRAVCATIIQRYVHWSTIKGPDDTRPRFYLGSCRELRNHPYVLVIYLDDDESSWNQTDINEFWYDMLLPSTDYLELKAAEWNVPLDFQMGYYATGMTEGIRVRYDGVVASNIMTESPSYDILEQAAASIGYSSEEAMHSSMQERSGQEEILYLIVMNKDGRSYAMPDSSDDGYENIEYCVLYPDYPDYTYQTPSSAVAHEVLHLYGAEDYYDPYGDTPGRASLAEQICPRDIMLTVYTDISYNELGGFTAYTLGWTDTLEEEYLDPRWWQ